MVLGIDLGTTNSCIACINESGQAAIIPDLMSGDRTTPSVVLFEEGSVIVGDVAKNSLVQAPNQTVSFIKREMGKEYPKPAPFPNGFTPVEISAEILKDLVNKAKESLGKDCSDVVITCPAYFGTVEREQIIQAGKLAGLNVKSIINEPVAAAVAYGASVKNLHAPKFVLVYDLGGGTFDVTAIKIENNNFTVLATGGCARLGGYDWDLRLAEKLLNDFNRETGNNVSFEQDIAIKHHFMLEAETAKKNLTSREKLNVSIGWEGVSCRPSITRSQFEEITKDLLNETITTLKETLNKAQQAGFRLDENTDILLVGGSSRMPQIKARLKREFPECKINLHQPDECVAKGAALFGNSNEISEQILTPVVLNNVTSKTYGTDCRKTRSRGLFVKNLIFSNTPIPVEKSETFMTAEDNQREINIKIYESDSTEQIIEEDAAKMISGNHVLKLPEKLPVHSPVEIVFRINSQGVLRVSARAQGSSKTFEVEI